MRENSFQVVLYPHFFIGSERNIQAIRAFFLTFKKKMCILEGLFLQRKELHQTAERQLSCKLTEVRYSRSRRHETGRDRDSYF